jgi:hypothetical protein
MLRIPSRLCVLWQEVVAYVTTGESRFHSRLGQTFFYKLLKKIRSFYVRGFVFSQFLHEKKRVNLKYATTASFYVLSNLVSKILTFDVSHEPFRGFCSSGVHCYVVDLQNFLVLCNAFCQISFSIT